MLLWEWILIVFSAIVTWIYSRRHRELMPWVLMIFSIVSAFFLAVIAFVSNPFEIVAPVPLDGRGLNPLLEDANMMTHPPLLYTGFVGLTMPYAFAMAALIVGELATKLGSSPPAVGRSSRGIFSPPAISSAPGGPTMCWAGAVTGPGTRWKTPRSCPGCRRRRFCIRSRSRSAGACSKVWNLSLIIIAFSLTIFGTFLTRSGILSSIHAFSAGPVGTVFLGFLGFVLLGLLRSSRLPLGSPQGPSRSSIR